MPRRNRYTKKGRPSLYKKEGKKIRIVELGEDFESFSDAAKRIGGRRGGVHACLRGTGNRKTHMGYTFKFVK